MIKSIEQQFEELKKNPRYSNAKIECLERNGIDGVNLITIYDFPIPIGWNKSLITATFEFKDFYIPEHFWTHEDINYTKDDYDNCVPQWTQHGYMGYEYPKLCRVMWFYRPVKWSQLNDTLLTYANFIRTRFNRLK